MTDPRPICPIPPDAKVGDVVVGSYGGEHRITGIYDDTIETTSYYFRRDGSCPGILNYCVGFIYADGSKPNLHHTGKPKRTQAQRDAAWLRTMANRWYSALLLTKSTLTRMNNIADRLEKQQ